MSSVIQVSIVDTCVCLVWLHTDHNKLLSAEWEHVAVLSELKWGNKRIYNIDAV